MQPMVAHRMRLAQPLVADRCYARARWCPTGSAERSSSTRRPTGLGDRHRAAPRRPLVQRRSRDRPAPRRRDAADLARARRLPRPRRDGRPAAHLRVPLAAPGAQRARRGHIDPRRVHPRAGRRGHAAPRGRERLPAAELGRGRAGPLRRRERARAGSTSSTQLRDYADAHGRRGRGRRPAMGGARRPHAPAAARPHPRVAATPPRAPSPATLPITRQGVAKHLAVLERAGLVEAPAPDARSDSPSAEDRLDQATRHMAQVARPVGPAPRRDQAHRRGDE